MKPRNKKQQHIVELSGRLRPLTTPPNAVGTQLYNQSLWLPTEIRNVYLYEMRTRVVGDA